MGGGDGSSLPANGTDNPGAPSQAPAGNGNSVNGESEFPLPDDAINVTNMGNDVLNFQTHLTLDDGMNFYRDQFGKLGYTERTLLTVTSDTTFSMVFDGHPSGKAITVQGVDLGNGTTNISITLADV